MVKREACALPLSGQNVSHSLSLFSDPARAPDATLGSDIRVAAICFSMATGLTGSFETVLRSSPLNGLLTDPEARVALPITA